MNQDFNNILTNLSNEYSGQLANANQKVAILIEDIRLAKEENEELRKELENLRKELTSKMDEEVKNEPKQNSKSSK